MEDLERDRQSTYRRTTAHTPEGPPHGARNRGLSEDLEKDEEGSKDTLGLEESIAQRIPAPYTKKYYTNNHQHKEDIPGPGQLPLKKNLPAKKDKKDRIPRNSVAKDMETCVFTLKRSLISHKRVKVFGNRKLWKAAIREVCRSLNRDWSRMRSLLAWYSENLANFDLPILNHPEKFTVANLLRVESLAMEDIAYVETSPHVHIVREGRILSVSFDVIETAPHTPTPPRG